MKPLTVKDLILELSKFPGDYLVTLNAPEPFTYLAEAHLPRGEDELSSIFEWTGSEEPEKTVVLE